MFNYFSINRVISIFCADMDTLNLHRSVIRQNPQRHEALKFNDWLKRRVVERCPLSGGILP